MLKMKYYVDVVSIITIWNIFIKYSNFRSKSFLSKYQKMLRIVDINIEWSGVHVSVNIDIYTIILT